jgi:hypothetical protein
MIIFGPLRFTTRTTTFCRIHQTLRVTPAMEAGISDHVWLIEEVVSLLDTSDKIVA